MGTIQLAIFGLLAVTLEVCQAQCFNRMCSPSSVLPTRTIITRTSDPCRCTTSSGTEDLNKLILLAKLLVQNNAVNANNNKVDSDAIIKKLIDALIYTTLQYNQCRAALELLVRGSKGGSNGGGSSTGSGGSGGSANGSGTGGKSLIDLGLLNPNNPDNVLDLELAGQDLLGIGLGKTGGGSGAGGKGISKSGGGGSGSGTGPLIDLGLLRPNQEDNVLDLNLAGQDLLGVGLGNSGAGSGGKSGGSGGGKPSGSGGKSAIDLGLLQPGSPDNVLDLDLSGQNLLGVGLGN